MGIEDIGLFLERIIQGGDPAKEEKAVEENGKEEDEGNDSFHEEARCVKEREREKLNKINNKNNFYKTKIAINGDFCFLSWKEFLNLYIFYNIGMH